MGTEERRKTKMGTALNVTKLAFCVCVCTECPEWKYGENCAEDCACDQMGAEGCDKVAGGCRCKPGWTGATCSSSVNECEADPAPCPAHSTCNDTEGSYECTCDTGHALQTDGNCTGQCLDPFPFGA